MSEGVSSVRAWLRAEALVVFVAGTLVWVALDGGWWRFLLFFLTPDLSLVAYLAGPRAGSIAYNVAHSYVIPAVVAVVAAVVDNTPALLLGSIWTAHIGFDRVLGYGLKHPGSFHETHLGTIGSRRESAPGADAGADVALELRHS